MIAVGMIGDMPSMMELIVRDVEQGVGCCLFDSEGSATEAIIARIPEHLLPRAFLLDPFDEEYCFGLNLFACDAKDSRQVANTVTYAVALFTSLLAAGEHPTLGVAMRDMVRAIALTLIANPGSTIAHVPRLLTNAPTRARLVGNVGDQEVRLYWETYTRLDPQERRATTRSLLSALRELLADSHIRHIVGQPRTTVDFPELLDSGGVLLVMLSPAHWQLSCVLCYVILGLFANAALGRRDAHKREEAERFRFYADGYTWNHFMQQQA